jgi:hypothetical protein
MRGKGESCDDRVGVEVGRLRERPSGRFATIAEQSAGRISRCRAAADPNVTDPIRHESKLPDSAGSSAVLHPLCRWEILPPGAAAMLTKKAEATDRQEVLDVVLALLRDAKEDCEVDCGPMALSKIDRAIRLLSQARADQRRRSTPILAGSNRSAATTAFGR